MPFLTAKSHETRAAKKPGVGQDFRVASHGILLGLVNRLILGVL